MPHACPEARRKYDREWKKRKRLEDVEAAREADRRKYYEKGGAARRRDYRVRHYDKNLAYQRKWKAAQNPHETAQKRKNWYDTTKLSRREYARKWGETIAGRSSTLFSNRRKWAKSRGLEFSLTRDWVAEKLEMGKCEATGLPFVLDEGMNAFSPSIDKIDQTRGYTPDNCRMVIYIFNTARNVYTDADVEKMCRAFIAKIEAASTS